MGGLGEKLNENCPAAQKRVEWLDIWSWAVKSKSSTLRETALQQYCLKFNLA